ncbi:hypothetical protein HOF65_03505 [bacterium]|nr:hypothetical protein [bacterium]MBT3853052.1 hypothetical protein [bacterium]MBT4633317.1 hypothetical protein [bacterium]MBT6779301.1 hypothetical protein [bacterium]
MYVPSSAAKCAKPVHSLFNITLSFNFLAVIFIQLVVLLLVLVLECFFFGQNAIISIII